MHSHTVFCQVHREPVPEELGASELTSLCYGASPLLYCGSSSGQICVWDTGTGHCFLAWEADDGEIGECPATSLALHLSWLLKCGKWAFHAHPVFYPPCLSSRSAAVFRL